MHPDLATAENPKDIIGATKVGLLAKCSPAVRASARHAVRQRHLETWFQGSERVDFTDFSCSLAAIPSRIALSELGL